MAHTRRLNPETPAAIQAGEPVSVEGLSALSAQLVGAGTFTVVLEGTNGSKTSGPWFVLQALTVNTVHQIAPFPVRFVRANTTAFTSGEPRVLLTGTD